MRSEVASRDTAITCKDARIANLEGTLTEKERSSQDFLERTKLRHSALIRAIVCGFLFTFSELLSLTLALAFGTGPNMMQRVTSSWVFLAGQLPFWGIIFICVEGRERLKHLGWSTRTVVEWATGRSLDIGWGKINRTNLRFQKTTMAAKPRVS